MSETDGPAVFVHLLPSLIPPGALKGAVAVVVDVLRATTVMVRALESGSEAIIPCGEIEEAKAVAASLPAGTALLAGERQGLPIPTFDLGNSPDTFTPGVCRGKTLVMTTTNGTRAILASRDAEHVGIAARSNATEAIRWAGSWGLDVHVVCAGTDGRISLEDSILAGEFAYRLNVPWGYVLGNDEAVMTRSLFLDSCRMARKGKMPMSVFMAQGRGGRRVQELGLPADLRAAAESDRCSIVPVLERDPFRIVVWGRAEGSDG